MERSDPNRSDWLSNVWTYIREVEERIAQLEERIIRLEAASTKEEPPLKVTIIPLDSP